MIELKEYQTAYCLRRNYCIITLKIKFLSEIIELLPYRSLFSLLATY